MRVCFIGLGSIASRHIKNIKELYPEMEIDVLRHSTGHSIPVDTEAFISRVYTDKSQMSTGYDAIFITNPTSLHYQTLIDMAKHGKSFFIEKPVFQTGDVKLNRLPLSDDTICYVACPLRYTNVVQYIKNNLIQKRVYSVRVISSSFLPEWRPGYDYRKTYSAKKELGGGVSIDLIHEWDYLRYLFGMPNHVKSIISQKSNLQIDSDDIALYIAEYEDKTIEVHLDYFGRVPTRKLEMFCEDDVIEVNLINQKIEFKKNGNVLFLTEDRDSYQKKELIHFFSIIKGEIENDNTIEEACETLRIAESK